jgi:hypothetical protein
MPTSNWTRIVVGLAAATWTAIVLASGDVLKVAWIRAVGATAAIVVLLLLAYDHWVWRWWGVRHLIRRPLLRGTWKTELRTSYEDRADDAIEGFLAIQQTYSTISIAMLFDRSKSVSVSGEFVRENDRYVLYYVFRSDKSTLQREDNPPARGAAHLTIATAPSVHLEGDYWMEHGTHGRVSSVGHSPVIYDTYRAAQRGEYD